MIGLKLHDESPRQAQRPRRLNGSSGEEQAQQKREAVGDHGESRGTPEDGSKGWGSGRKRGTVKGPFFTDEMAHVYICVCKYKLRRDREPGQ
jgi:hypothetical protein